MLSLKDKKILVTGGHGFLGKHVIKNLIEKRGVPVGNIYAPDHTECDLTDPVQARKAVAGKDVVIHLAGLSVSMASNISPSVVLYSNTMMGLNVLEAARVAGVQKFISIGSANEYPRDAPMPLKESSLWDGVPEAGLRAYSVSKKVMDLAVQLYPKDYGFNAVHLIMTSMYGPGFHLNISHLMPLLIRQIESAKAKNEPHITGWGTGKATRDFLYVEDAAEGIVKATESYEGDGPVNIATGVETPVGDVMRMLCELLDFKGEIKWDPTKPEGQLRYVLDVSRAEKEFGFRATTPIADGLAKTVKYYRDELHL